MCIRDRGGAAVVFISIVANSDFSRSTTCGASLAPGSNCLVSVVFAPTAVVSYLGSLLITSDSVGSPHTINLSGSGVVSAGVALSPGSLAFATQLQGSPSAAKTITLLNSGTAALTLNLNGITTSGDFDVTHNCGTGPAAGASCTPVSYTHLDVYKRQAVHFCSYPGGNAAWRSVVFKPDCQPASGRFVCATP